jgi:carbonic anhydrase/acetyltransferase-like protein (isoleucine patch superfamily)
MIIRFGGATPRIHPTAWIAPTATVIGNVDIGAEATVWFGAVIRGDEPSKPITIGARTSVQDNCVIHVSSRAPTIIGEGVTIGHGAVLESCVIGDSALIGMNAVVLAMATVGAGSLIAAGSVVGEGAEVPPRMLAAGAPARVKREIEPGQLALIQAGADHYVELGSQYLAEQADGASPGETGG